MINRIPELIARGCDISVENGVLVVTHPTDNRYSREWLKKYRLNLINELGTIAGLPIYLYISRSTGNYGNKSADGKFTQGKRSGLCLQFVNAATGESHHAIFNVILERVRSTATGTSGSQLPKGRFTVRKRSAFANFWETTGLGKPRRWSELYKCIGKLSSLCFTAELNNDSQKLVNASIKPVNLTSAYLKTLVGGNESTRLRQASDKKVARISDNQLRQVEATSACDKEIATSLESPSYSPDSRYVGNSVRVNSTTSQNTTRQKNYELSNKGRADKDSTSSTLKIKSPRDQTNDEWWSDYDKAS